VAVVTESSGTESDDSGIQEVPARRITLSSGSNSENDDRAPAPSPPADPPAPACPSVVELLRREIAELRAEVRSLRDQVQQRSTTHVKVIAEETSDSDASAERPENTGGKGVARRRRHRRRRRPSSSAMDARPSITLHSSGSSETEREDSVKHTNTEVCVAKAPADANPRTPEVDPAIGSPLSAASVQTVRQQESITRRNVCNTGRRIDVNPRTPAVDSLDGSLSSAASASSARGQFKELVIWNTNFKQNPEIDDEFCSFGSPIRPVQENHRHQRRAGFWGSGSDAPSWRARH